MDLSKAIQIDPNESKLYYLRGKAFYQQRHYQVCFRCFGGRSAFALLGRTSGARGVWYGVGVLCGLVRGLCILSGCLGVCLPHVRPSGWARVCHLQADGYSCNRTGVCVCAWTWVCLFVLIHVHASECASLRMGVRGSSFCLRMCACAQSHAEWPGRRPALLIRRPLMILTSRCSSTPTPRTRTTATTTWASPTQTGVPRRLQPRKNGSARRPQRTLFALCLPVLS